MKWSIVAILALGTLLVLSERRAATQTVRDEIRPGEVGRYRLTGVGTSTQLFMIDTATGQCWRHEGTRSWRDIGNPTRRDGRGERRAERDGDEASLKLPTESVELTIVQREVRSIPGSDGSVQVHLGDITDGQAFLSVVTGDHRTLLDRTSVSEDEAVQFAFGGQKYEVRIRELRNVLIGDDFAKLEITEAESEETPVKARAKQEK
jgi:hypothetical protein